jgi:hypothetical protein
MIISGPAGLAEWYPQRGTRGKHSLMRAASEVALMRSHQRCSEHQSAERVGSDRAADPTDGSVARATPLALLVEMWRTLYCPRYVHQVESRSLAAAAPRLSSAGAATGPSHRATLRGLLASRRCLPVHGTIGGST